MLKYALKNPVRETFKLALALPIACAICFTAQAQPVPTGSYQESCSNISVNGTTLQATCKTFNQRDNNTAFPHYASCAGDIGNVNGVLACTAPNGSSAQQGNSIKFDEPVTGTLNDSTAQISYSFKGTAGDVVSADIMTTSEARATQKAGFSPQALDVHATIVDSGNKELASSLPGHDKGTFDYSLHSTIFAALPADGTYTVVAERSPASHLVGDFKLTVTKASALKSGNTVKTTLTVKDAATKNFGAIYVVQSDNNFVLTYKKTGLFSPTLHISNIRGRDPHNLASSNGRLQTIASLTGPQNNFVDLTVAPEFQGASLYIAGRKEPYIVTIFNNDAYDSLFFVKSRAPDASANCELTLSEPGN